MPGPWSLLKDPFHITLAVGAALGHMSPMPGQSTDSKAKRRCPWTSDRPATSALFESVASILRVDTPVVTASSRELCDTTTAPLALSCLGLREWIIIG